MIVIHTLRIEKAVYTAEGNSDGQNDKYRWFKSYTQH